MAVLTLDEKYQKISEDWTKSIETLSSAVATYRIKLGVIMNDLDIKIDNLEDDKKIKAEFKKAKVAELIEAHDLQMAELRKSARLANSGLSISDAQKLGSLPYNHLFSVMMADEAQVSMSIFSKILVAHYIDIQRKSGNKIGLSEVNDRIVPALENSPRMFEDMKTDERVLDLLPGLGADMDNGSQIWDYVLSNIVDKFHKPKLTDWDERSFDIFNTVKIALDAHDQRVQDIAEEKKNREEAQGQDGQDGQGQDGQDGQGQDQDAEDGQDGQDGQGEDKDLIIEKLARILYLAKTYPDLDLSRLIPDVDEVQWLESVQTITADALNIFIASTKTGKDVPDIVDPTNVTTDPEMDKVDALKAMVQAEEDMRELAVDVSQEELDIRHRNSRK